MTNQGDGSRGSSLFQTRKTRQDHNHNHNHNHHNQHRHLHSLHSRPNRARQSFEEEEEEEEDITTSPYIRSPPLPQQPKNPSLPTPANVKVLHERQVVVVQTVSVVQFIDATGAPVSVSTLRSDPVAPTPINLPAGVTAGLTDSNTPLPIVSLPSIGLDLSDGTPSATPATPTDTLSSSSEPILSSSTETLTSAPSPNTTPSFPVLLPSGGFNSSSTIRLPSLFHNSTTLGIFSNSTRTQSSSTLLSSTTLTSVSTTSSGSSTRTSSSADGFATVFAGGSDGESNAGAGAHDSGPAEPTATSSPGLTPETRNAVVGGVVGGVAGIAIAALLIMMFLKWRKRSYANGIRLLGDGESTIRGNRFSGPSGGGGFGSAAAMAQRSVPFAVPSALAKLTGKRAIEGPAAAEPTQEKGFYRVSGRKLKSVLESGGDGYSDPDPHDSISGTSYYRDSQAFLDSSNLPPLQLGSPMRPDSGVPIFHTGPQRTPVQEHGPFPPGHRPSAFPNMLQIPELDPLGRSLMSQDGSRVSQSRFTENS
ncbi:hypothetical protein QBC38DRAFT_471077 [Podospora fimiseda]|uniref:Uncharacterized protein n=1 Tax=Podospora fimiseda TaxID=252190 RepID=A0AAN7BUH7_9PEZI|nr:hypothetical protein QBC38DRAFT_471077 [Podospora fimiseda]